MIRNLAYEYLQYILFTRKIDIPLRFRPLNTNIGFKSYKS